MRHRLALHTREHQAGAQRGVPRRQAARRDALDGHGALRGVLLEPESLSSDFRILDLAAIPGQNTLNNTTQYQESSVVKMRGWGGSHGVEADAELALAVKYHRELVLAIVLMLVLVLAIVLVLVLVLVLVQQSLVLVMLSQLQPVLHRAQHRLQVAVSGRVLQEFLALLLQPTQCEQRPVPAVHRNHEQCETSP